MAFMTQAEYEASLCSGCGTYGDRPHSIFCPAFAMEKK